MDETYKLIADLAKEVVPPAEGVASRALFANDRLKAVGFGFAAGVELKEHTAPVPVVLYVRSGEATLTLGGDRHEATAGAWVYVPAKLPHSITARTPVTLLLLLLK